MAGRVPPSLSFRGEDLRAVLLPAATRTNAGRVLALEIYRDGLIVRATRPAPESPSRPPAPFLAAETGFALTDDVGGAYAFAGSVAGGTPTTHVMAMFVPAPPAGASWLEAASPLGWARFDL